MSGAQILGIFLVVLVVIVICSSIRVVPQAHTYVIERLGTYKTTWSAGLHLKTPFIDKVAHHISMKEQVVDFAPQPVITKDNVTMRIDRSEAVCIRRGKANHGDRESDSDNPSKYHW